MVRVRFAPSPTGYLHIGGLRTCLYNWLYAKKNHGTFILRIEDTDQSRSETGFLKNIQSMLEWLGFCPDEGPFYQSERLNIYHKQAENLLKSGFAYEEAQEGSPGKALRFKLKPEEVVFQDHVYGRIRIDNRNNDDFIILKSDAMPSYNFACVVDDALMGITHVIRGDDHISNTPKQIALYQALGFSVPEYIHVPMILGSDGKRLSKRHGATAVSAYKEQGFIAYALLNYLALLGWSPGDNREVMDLDEMIESFSIDRILKKSAVFDPEKLLWMNAQHIRKMTPQKFEETLKEFVPSWMIEDPSWEALIKLHQNRTKILTDFSQQTAYFFGEAIHYDSEAAQKHLSDPVTSERLIQLANTIEKIDPYDVPNLEKSLRDMADGLGVKAAQLIHPARVALTGATASPGIFELMVLLGKKRVCERLCLAAQWSNDFRQGGVS
ncbi:MAG: glutamate--tRNA ligase [Chlamydiota bacterium]|nr:glutamate--tRNA ligase [Chlamydiota bacterium]